MSKLDKLIEELCPDGVEYVTLGDMCEISSAGVDKKIVVGEPSVKLLNYMDVYRNRNITQDILTMQVTAPISKLKNCNIEKGDIFITPTSETIEDIGHASVAMETIDGGVYSYHLMRLRLKKLNMVTAFYMSYVFSSSALRIQILKLATGLTRFGLTKGNWEKIRIPLPPLPVQQEIVRILDNFTELTAELSLRKKQYEYYRDKLLTFGDDVEYLKIKDVYKRLQGTPITAEKMKEIQQPNGEIRVFAGGKTVINAFEKDIPKANITKVPAVLVQSRGVIDVVYYEEHFTFKNEMWAYTTDNKLSVKYLYYVLKNNIQQFRDAASGMGSLPQISLKVTEEFQIPLPPLAEQQRIVDILDRFDALCNDLSSGLPAEIEARKKQYEYYRDKLLTFKELS